jgi:hypothetical protein
MFQILKKIIKTLVINGLLFWVWFKMINSPFPFLQTMGSIGLAVHFFVLLELAYSAK